ncbi:MAG TPA: LytTR family DNA-binding domain-containing protein [Pyrinomonadaceae bacterium]|nr:LytTR family DNA-binding domain-containing protein [Pyrinomonadaceae bacterium]
MTNRIRTLIVDDMILARKRLRRVLRQDAEIEIIGECADGREAVEAVERMKPDLMFLDVQMPEMDGFEAMAEIAAANAPVVIFVTAFDHFALRAFEVHALDYLLKPFDAERLKKTVERAKEQIKKRGANDGAQAADERLLALLKDVKTEPKYLRRLTVKSRGRTIFLTVDDIDYVEAEGNYLTLQVGKEAHLIRSAMHQLEEKLDPEKFARIHRSTIINLDRVKEMHPMFNGDQLVIMKNGKELTLSRNYRDRLKDLLESF